MATIATSTGTVAFEELNGWPKFEGARESRSAVRKGIIPWVSIDALFNELFPPPPAPPGQYPGVPQLYAESLEIEPQLGEESCSTSGFNTNIYAFAIATIRYTTLPYESDTLLQARYSVGAEFLRMPGRSLYWEDDDEPIKNEDVQAGKLIPMIEHSFTRYRAVSIPWTAIRANIGCVNDGIYRGVADQQLLFVGAEISWQYEQSGVQTWTLDYRFHERNIKVGNNTYGWNHVFDPTSKTWRKVIDGNGNSLYKKVTTFDQLFA